MGIFKPSARYLIDEMVRETDEAFTLPEDVVSSVASAYSIKEAMKLVRQYAAKGMEARARSGQTSGSVRRQWRWIT